MQANNYLNKMTKQAQLMLKESDKRMKAIDLSGVDEEQKKMILAHLSKVKELRKKVDLNGGDNSKVLDSLNNVLNEITNYKAK
jgi:phosphoribosylformimino-5-aminoimidazole carboxamide ribonucleotide (ProFAR) isomerase